MSCGIKNFKYYVFWNLITLVSITGRTKLSKLCKHISSMIKSVEAINVSLHETKHIWHSRVKAKTENDTSKYNLIYLSRKI